MDQPHESTPESATQAAESHASRNGTVPISDELKHAIRALEEIDMRLHSIQLACAVLAGLVLLNLALEIKELRG